MSTLNPALTENNCTTLGGVHTWEYLGNEDDLVDTYKCKTCKRTVYEQLRPFGSPV